MQKSEESNHYNVVFTTERGMLTEQVAKTIVISPSEDKWNDFGYRIRANMEIYPLNDKFDSVKSLDLICFFAFLGESGRIPDVRLLEYYLNESNVLPLEKKYLQQFFTMLPDLETYRSIVRTFGAGEAQLILKSVNDMVAIEAAPKRGAWLHDAINTAIFQKGFLRSSESFFAWKNAEPILRGLAYEEIGSVSDTLNIKFQLAGQSAPQSVKFKFDPKDPDLPRRFAVMIGRNGVGKSQTLANIAKSAMQGTSNLTDGDGERPSMNRILAYSATSATLTAFPSEKRGRPRIWYRRFTLDSAGNQRNKQRASDLIVQLARTNEDIQSVSRLQIFLNAISAIEDWRQISLLTKGPIKVAVPLEELLSGGEEALLDIYSTVDTSVEPVRVLDGENYKLSSGELSFLRFAALASLYIENGSVLLIDEPETHLHPNFISQFVKILDFLLESTGSVAIIATHSVYLVREAFEDQVIVLRSEVDRSIVSETPTLKTFGADVGAISYFVFGEDEPSLLAKAVESKIADDTSSWNEVFERYKGELSLDVLADIRARIEGRSEQSKNE